MLAFLPQARFTASTVIPLILISTIGYVLLTKTKGNKVLGSIEKPLKIQNLANYLIASVVVFLISLMLFEGQGIADWNYTIHEVLALFINVLFYALPFMFISFAYHILRFFIKKGMGRIKGQKTPITSILMAIISFAVYVVTIIAYLGA